MVLCWRRHGRAGGCRIRKEIIKKIWHTVTKAFIPVIETLDDCMAVRKTWKQAECSLKTEYRDQNLKYSKLTDINMKLVEVKTSEVARRFEQISLVIKTSNCKQYIFIIPDIQRYVWRSRPTRRRLMVRLSEQERRVDALALRADERRDKLR